MMTCYAPGPLSGCNVAAGDGSTGAGQLCHSNCRTMERRDGRAARWRTTGTTDNRHNRHNRCGSDKSGEAGG